MLSTPHNSPSSTMNTTHKHLDSFKQLESLLFHRFGISNPLIDLSILTSDGTLFGFGDFDGTPCRFITLNKNRINPYRKLVIYSSDGNKLSEKLY